MSQSLSQLIVHIIFGTKNREPFLRKPIRKSLFAYLSTVCHHLGCHCISVGGYNDHIHLAIILSRTMSVATLVQKVKSSSSKWLKSTDVRLKNFAWQRGYAAFSVRSNSYGQLVDYINNQDTHHFKQSFREEYICLLKASKIEFDERFIWE